MGLSSERPAWLSLSLARAQTTPLRRAPPRRAAKNSPVPQSLPSADAPGASREQLDATLPEHRRRVPERPDEVPAGRRRGRQGLQAGGPLSAAACALLYFNGIRRCLPRQRTAAVLLKEVRRRTRVVGRFPTEKSALVLIWASIEQDRLNWRGVRMSSSSTRHGQEGPGGP